MRKYVFNLVLTALLTTAGAAAAGQQAPARTALGPPPVSPFELARVVNRARARREKGLAAEEINLAATWERLGVPAGEFERGEYCEAELFRHELDGARGREVLLKLSRGHDFYRYLVFKRAARGRWRLLGFVDHDFNRYAPSRHRVARAAGRNWLVVWGQEGSGSGYSLYAETWYEVRAEGLRPVLRYPAEGHVAPWPAGVGRGFVARAAAHGGGVSLRYTVDYERLDGVKDESVPLYRNRHRLLYAWDARQRSFAVDRGRSDISEPEVAAIADLQAAPGGGRQLGGSTFFPEGAAWKRGGYDVFLKYNLGGLLRLARRGDAADAEWLRELLKDCADTPERRALARALDRRR